MKEYLVIFLVCIVVTSMLNPSGGLAGMLQASNSQQGIAGFLIGGALLLLVAKGISMMSLRQKHSESD